MIEIAEKEDINRIDGELVELRRNIQEFEQRIRKLNDQLQAVNEAFIKYAQAANKAANDISIAKL